MARFIKRLWSWINSMPSAEDHLVRSLITRLPNSLGWRFLFTHADICGADDRRKTIGPNGLAVRPPGSPCAYISESDRSEWGASLNRLDCLSTHAVGSRGPGGVVTMRNPIWIPIVDDTVATDWSPQDYAKLIEEPSWTGCCTLECTRNWNLNWTLSTK